MSTLSCNNEGNLKESQQSTDVKEETRDFSTETLLPQDVLCDSCIDSPSKALKSCLTCLVSYCEAHLRPHLENVKFQNHRLVDPLHDIDCRTCEIHLLPLDGFCLTDGCCVCLDCVNQEHEGHTTASVGEARAQIEVELQKKQEDISQSASATEKTIGKLQSNNDLIKCSVQEVCVIVEQQFARLHTTVEEARKGAVEVLEAEQRQALRQAEGIQAHLEQRKSKADENFGSNEQTVQEQEYSEWKKGVSDVCMPTAYINRMDHLTSYAQVVTDATKELCDLILSSYREKLNLICKSATQTSPDRFEYWRQAVTLESLYQGRHYIEAELSGEGAHVGVTYKSIDRKGEQNTSCITGNDFSWCVGRNSRGFFAWHAGLEVPLEVTHITRVGLYVDFQRGSVSFYDVTDAMTLLHKYTANFIEPLYVTAWLSKKDNVVSLVDTK
ncbi:Tripartite motif-containing protein 16 [Collichthys lucidus]|uniref:Tripartite motif-containing protein 16 n=1 Tax=Collichthys lucidus TaxID=240159 RepID=A0A4U5VTL0_COLLU|nr:Tripartite motif-containing protein 16 [Collichthys lucidus]